MGDDKKWCKPEHVLLKECYELAEQFEPLDIVKSVLREKAKAIDIPDEYLSANTDVSLIESDMQIISDSIYAMTAEPLGGAASGEIGTEYRFNNLAPSGEKEYCQALMALRRGNTETQRIQALRHLVTALGYSPDDPRYIALATVLRDVDS